MAFMIPAVGAPQANSGGGGSDLPPVTAEDNGDVLTVVNGAWDKAAPSGGGGVLIVNMTITDTAMTLDKTWQEIYDAVPAVMVVDPTENDKSVYMVYEVYVDDGYHVDIGHGSISFPPFYTDLPTGYPSSGDV